MNFENIFAWSVEIAIVVAAAALAAFVLRLRAPGARLFYWRVVLVASLLLPLVRPWKPQPITGDVTVSTVVLSTHVDAATLHYPSPREAVLWLLAAGIAVRLLWLGVGFWKLGRYRRQSRPFGSRDGAALLLSNAITSPVTFGAWRPVVLLPARFPEFAPVVQEAILCHEIRHVQRRDWLCMVAEELVRSALWFHPAVWWLLAEIGLAREQEVDREVVAATRTRDEYVDALLAIARAGAQLDLAPAPLFLRKRHLKRRVVSILKEVPMSKTRLVSSLAAAVAVLAAACWLATATFPLSAAPEAVADSPGVQVDAGGAALLHRTPVIYPEGAREQGVAGTVVVQAAVDTKGNVSDAQVLSGPEELRRAALSSVLNWHFVADNSGKTRQISITFQPGYAEAAPKPAAVAAAPSSALAGLVIQRISINGLSDSARTQLLSQLGIHEGDTLAAADIAKIQAAAANFDQHLRVTYRTNFTGSATNLQSSRVVEIEIEPAASEPPTPPAPGAPAAQGPRLRIGGNVQSTKLSYQPRPAYPPLAKQAHIQGTVKLDAIIGKDGNVLNLSVISGHPLLVPTALEAVKQWVYQPTLLNGNPVEVETEIDVNFTLSQ
jgi:TonB family protein